MSPPTTANPAPDTIAFTRTPLAYTEAINLLLNERSRHRFGARPYGISRLEDERPADHPFVSFVSALPRHFLVFRGAFVGFVSGIGGCFL